MLWCLMSKLRIAAALACVVLAYTTLSPFLACGSDHSHRRPGVAHAGGPPAQHHEHGAHHPSQHQDGAPIADACCNASLYHVVFESPHLSDGVRTQAFTRLPPHQQPVFAPVGRGSASAAFNRATGPPWRSGANTDLYAARPRFLVVSSLLV